MGWTMGLEPIGACCRPNKVNDLGIRPTVASYELLYLAVKVVPLDKQREFESLCPDHFSYRYLGPYSLTNRRGLSQTCRFK